MKILTAFLASYRTTLASFVLAGLEMYKDGMTFKTLLISLAIIVFGTLAKDANVTMSTGYIPKTVDQNGTK